MARSAKADPEVQSKLEQLTAYLSKQGLKNTKQRSLVAAAVFEAEHHINVDEIYQRVRGKDSKVGYSTVYRTLKLLKDCGLVSERNFGDGVTRYETIHDGEHHDHLICTRCKSIVEFEDPDIEDQQDKIASRFGFSIESHKHEIYGICQSCQKGGRS